MAEEKPKRKKWKPPPSTAEEAAAFVNEKYGGAVVVQPATQIEYPFDLRRPTGFLSLDLAMGGGFPAGTLNQLFGPDNTGKTLTMAHTAATNQKIYGKDSSILALSLGYGIDKAFFRMCGCSLAFSTREIEGLKSQAAQVGQKIDPKTLKALKQQAGMFMLLDLGYGETAETRPTESQLEAALDMVKSGAFQLVLMDEAVGAGATADRLNRPLYQEDRTADEAKMITGWLKKLLSAFKVRRKDGSPNESTVLYTSQVREDLRTFIQYKKPKQPGGKMLTHIKVMDVHFKRVGSIAVGQRRVGHRMQWTLSKAKHGAHDGPKGELSVRFDMPGGIVDIAEDLALVGKTYGVIRNRGNLWDILDGPGGDGVVGVKGGFTEVVKLCRDPAMDEKIRQDVLSNAGGEWRWK